MAEKVVVHRPFIPPVLGQVPDSTWIRWAQFVAYRPRMDGSEYEPEDLGFLYLELEDTVYSYANTPYVLYYELIHAESPGQYFNYYIRNNYSYRLEVAI